MTLSEYNDKKRQMEEEWKRHDRKMNYFKTLTNRDWCLRNIVFSSIIIYFTLCAEIFLIYYNSLDILISIAFFWDYLCFAYIIGTSYQSLKKLNNKLVIATLEL